MPRLREWPTKAAQARDEAAMLAQEAIIQLEPLLMSDRQITDTERVRRLARALVAIQKTARLLESVGARTNLL